MIRRWSCGTDIYLFVYYYYFFFERETEHEQGRGRQRGRHRIWSRLQADQRRAWTHKPWGLEPKNRETVRSWLTSLSRMLNQMRSWLTSLSRSLTQALHDQHRAWHGARTHKRWDLSQSPTLNWLSHPCAPRGWCFKARINVNVVGSFVAIGFVDIFVTV